MGKGDDSAEIDQGGECGESGGGEGANPGDGVTVGLESAGRPGKIFANLKTAWRFYLIKQRCLMPGSASILFSGRIMKNCFIIYNNDSKLLFKFSRHHVLRALFLFIVDREESAAP